jgi:predicted N-acetyltransferase YhbS
MAGLTPPRPLAETDDRHAFDCGRDTLNAWFYRHAWRNHQTGASRVTVICDRETGAIVGFVSLSAAQIERAFLPKADQRNRPDPLPALLLGQLAVDRQYHGRGYARSLMIYALTTAVHFASGVGCMCVITHPVDDGVRGFYRSFGFSDLPFDPGRSMAVRIVDLVASGFGSKI